MNTQIANIHLISGGIITFYDFLFQNVKVMKTVMMVQTLCANKDTALVNWSIFCNYGKDPMR